MNMLEFVNWEYVSFQELETLLQTSCCQEPVIDEELSCRLTPLCMACKHNREDLVSVLLHHGARVDKSSSFYSKRPLHFACDHSNRNLGMVRKLLTAKADVDAVDSDGSSALHVACTESNVPVVELLIECGAKVNILDVDCESPLVRACYARSTKLVDILLKAGSDPDVQGQPLEIAVRNQSIEILKLLMDAGANIHKGAYLSHASEHDHIETMKFLRNYGADVNKVNILGMTPLQTACRSNQSSIEAVQLLLHWGADVNEYSYTRETAMHCACDVQEIDKIRLLLAYGADVNAHDAHHLSPLMVALKNISQHQLEENVDIGVTIVRLLLAAGAKLRQETLERLKSSIFLLPRAVVNHGDLLSIMNSYALQPSTLQCLCRLSIRKSLPSNKDEKLDLLPLPPQLKRFLKFYEIVPVAYPSWHATRY